MTEKIHSEQRMHLSFNLKKTILDLSPYQHQYFRYYHLHMSSKADNQIFDIYF